MKKQMTESYKNKVLSKINRVALDLSELVAASEKYDLGVNQTYINSALTYIKSIREMFKDENDLND